LPSIRSAIFAELVIMTNTETDNKQTGQSLLATWHSRNHISCNEGRKTTQLCYHKRFLWHRLQVMGLIIWHIGLLQHSVERFSATHSLCMHRNGYLQAFGEKSNIQFTPPNYKRQEYKAVLLHWVGWCELCITLSDLLVLIHTESMSHCMYAASSGRLHVPQHKPPMRKVCCV